MKKALQVTFFCIAVMIAGYVLLGFYVRETFRLKFSPLSASERSRMAEMGKNLDELSQGIKNGSIPSRKIDRSSVGFPAKEAKLLTLRSEVDFFTAKFGHDPSRIEELQRLTELPDYSPALAKSVPVLRRECEIVNLETDSYILSCDGFSSLSTTQKEELLGSFGRETERFYYVLGHVILYVPPPTAGKPLRAR